METTLIEKAEKIKASIKDTAEKSKETIREIIDSNTKHIGEAIDSNKKIIDSIQKKLNQQEIDDSLTDTLKMTFGKSVELAEDALDSIINSYMRQMEMNIDFNTKLVDVIKESENGHPEKVLKLIHENFENAYELSVKNTKDILNFYNKNTNLAINFNQKFGESINTQIESLFNLQNKGMNKFAGWASEWWKQENKKENKVTA